MKNKRKDYNWTNNRGYYNKLRKHYLEVDAEIHCSYCKYNRGENRKGNWYGGFKGDGYYKIPHDQGNRHRCRGWPSGTNDEIRRLRSRHHHRTVREAGLPEAGRETGDYRCRRPLGQRYF